MSSLLLAVQHGHKGLLIRVQQLRNAINHSTLADPNLETLLLEMTKAASSQSEECTTKLATLVKALEYIVAGISIRDDKVNKLQAQVLELQLEISVQNFRQVYGDYTSNCVQLIIEEYIRIYPTSWEHFHRLLMKERRETLKEFQKQHPDKTDTDNSFITNMYSKGYHSELLVAANKLGWTANECDLLFTFNDERNVVSHSGLNKGSLFQKQALIATHKRILEEGVPAGLEEYEDVLKKAVAAFEFSLK